MQRGDKGRNIRVPVTWILLKGSEYRLLDIRGDMVIAVCRWDWRMVQMPVSQRSEIGCCERRVSGKNLVSDAAKRVLIAVRACYSSKLFGCHVGWRADHRSAAFASCRVH